MTDSDIYELDEDAPEASEGADADGMEESYLDDDSESLWDGDRGSLDAKQRDTLVMLLKKAFISSDDRTEWRTLLRDTAAIATNLNNLYLNLVLDPRSEVAYAAPARTADNPVKTLVTDIANNREETLVLLFLRERFRAATAAGEAHVFADAIAMYEYVKRLRPESATDHLGDERKVANAISGMVTAGLLVKTKDDGRYRVHRAIEALLPLPKLQQLLEAFKRQNSGTDEGAEAGGRDGLHESEPFGRRHGQPAGRHAAIDTSAADLERANAEVAAERIDVQYETNVAFSSEGAIGFDGDDQHDEGAQ